MIKQDARSLSPQAQQTLRVQAVKAMLDGMTQSEAARRFGVSRKTANAWMKQYRQGGMKVLKAKPQGRPKGPVAPPRLAGRPGRPYDHRPHARPDQDAICALDARRAGPTDPTALWRERVGVDRGPLAASVGFYPTEAGAPRVGAKSQTGRTLARGGVSANA